MPQFVFTEPTTQPPAASKFTFIEPGQSNFTFQEPESSTEKVVRAGLEGAYSPFKPIVDRVIDPIKDLYKEGKDYKEPQPMKGEAPGDFERRYIKQTLTEAGNYIPKAIGTAVNAVVPTMPLAGAMGQAAEKLAATKAGVPEKKADQLARDTGDVASMVGLARAPTELEAAKQLEPPAAVKNAVESVATGAPIKPVRKIFSPASVSPEAGQVAAAKREALGAGTRDTAATAAQLAPYEKRFDNLTPEEKVVFPQAMENASKGGLDKLPEDLKEAATAMRGAFKMRADKIKQTKSLKNSGLVEDYLNRNFVFDNNEQRSKFFGLVGKQGSGGNLRARTYPTYNEALKAAQESGGRPIDENFIRSANRYFSNMDMFIAHNQAWDMMKENGLIKYANRGGRVPEGWAPLEGRLAQKIGVTKDREPIMMQAYAPEDAARVYNNFLSQGIKGDVGSTMQTAQRAFNTIAMMKLGLSSVWHAGITGTAAISSDLARGTRQFLKGEPLKGAKSIALSPFAPYRVARAGAKFNKQYLRIADYGPDTEKLVNVATRANSLQTRRPAYMNAVGPKTFKELFSDARARPLTGGAKIVAHGIGKAMQAASRPMFDTWIPNMKRGVIIERLQQWVKEHPESTQEEQLAYARQLGDSVDNRFGEMMRDNLFWNKTLREAMQFGLLSYSWVAGATRMAAGAGAEAFKTAKMGAELGPNAEYLLANAVVSAVLGSVYQYMHTGQAPQNAKDALFPRTGGVQHVGKAVVSERAVLPSGHWTQYSEYMHDPLAELYNEGNIGAKVFWDALHNRDYRGMPIAKPQVLWNGNYLKEVPDAVWRYMQYIGGQALTPIAIQQYYNRNAGTGIKPTETIGLAARPAPGFISAPNVEDTYAKKTALREWKAKLKSDQRLAARKESNQPSKPAFTFTPPAAQFQFTAPQ